MSRYDPKLGDKLVRVTFTEAELQSLLLVVNTGWEDETYQESQPEESVVAAARAITKAYESLVKVMRDRELCECCGVRGADPKLLGRMVDRENRPMPLCHYCLDKQDNQSAQESEE